MMMSKKKNENGSDIEKSVTSHYHGSKISGKQQLKELKQ